MAAIRRMEKVTGRSDDMIILRGVNLFPTQIEEALVPCSWCSGHFQIELVREGRMDQMIVHVEARPEHWNIPETRDQAKAVTHHLKNTIGISATIVVVAPGSIERSSGKVKRVVDRRPVIEPFSA